MDRHSCKTLMVWLAVMAGAIGGCRCAPKTHPEAGMFDTGIGNPCSDTMPCPEGLYCTGGMCAQDCSDTMPCADGAMCTSDGRCVGGACIEAPILTGCGQACDASTPCPLGLYCGADGSCTADCSPSVFCPNAQTCSSDGHCTGGGSDAGICSGSGAPVGCGAGCGPTTLCLPGLYCSGGSCTADCTSATRCANGGMCSADGHCINGGMDAGVCSSPSAPGGCGNVCTESRPCPSGLYCSAGFCTADCIAGSIACANGLACSADGQCNGGGVTCTILQLECNGACIERLSDPDNCGTCRHVCPGTQVCSAGTCQNACSARQMNCNRACIDPMTDSHNCGACGHVCPNNELCYSGTCGCATTRGETECSSMCVNVTSDRENCGSCGNVCNTTCPSHPNTCANQGIQCGAASDGCGGMLDCGDCSTSVSGDTCGGGGLGGQCGQGATSCHPLSCQDLNVHCGPIGDGCGHIIQCGDCTLPDTCGGGGVLGQCGRPVCYTGSVGGTPTCEDMCPGGTTNCNHVCFHTDDDPRNCGGCGITCGLGTCSGGSCHCMAAAVDSGTLIDSGVLASCPPEGCIMCGPSIGCVNQATDQRHCGDCNTVCPSGSFCANGHCT